MRTCSRYKLKLEDQARFEEEGFIRHAEKELVNFAGKLDRSQLRTKSSLEKQLKLERTEQLKIQEDLHQFCSVAINNYINCLKLGDECDMQIFRICSLWFGAKQKKTIGVTTKVRCLVAVRLYFKRCDTRGGV